MRIAINGVGIAGPTLAWWLKRFGYEPVLFEKASELRKGGYIVDFWGSGYDIVEKMGILPDLESKSYNIKTLKCFNGKGKNSSNVDMEAMSKETFGRFLSLKRSDISEIIFNACGNMDVRFGCYISSIEKAKDGVVAHLSNGEKEKFDLIIGADGLHSQIRTLAFKNSSYEEFDLDTYVVALTLPDYEPREENAYVVSIDSKKQVAKAAIEDNKTLFLFTFRSELVEKIPTSLEERKEVLRSVFKDMEWEVPNILERLDDAEDIYFDKVCQIRMESWSSDRVALIGDAAACPSLLAGQGSMFAIMEAYVLAGELYKAKGDYKVAFENYEQILKKFIENKQKAALTNLAFFAPRNNFHKYLASIFLKMTKVPILSKFIIGSMFKEDIKLPSYDN
ncbi:FAD-binding domain [Francisella frigiditurris]|uniref:FAD binding domain protein n=1 Tax=Francisella frigiditurris TaxID=1542390 RepID=A0A1J0KRU9_9GAMM|nr:FAD-binding domain [Francisella frigiditurris]APC96348.1 FAD binding domain protein [Francisella frigiditurris]